MHRLRVRRLFRSALGSRRSGLSWLGALCAAFVSVAAIVLSHSPTHAHSPRPDEVPSAVLTPPAAQTVSGPLNVHAQWAHGAVLAHGLRTTTMEVTLNASGDVDERPPIAMAIVLDTSGSMNGEKIQQARNAVQRAVDRMRAGDRVAIVTYNSTARVVVPLGDVTSRRDWIRNAILEISSGGGTQIPNGMALGFDALHHAAPHFVRRIVLVSDGIDGSNVGPSGASALARSYMRHGVTTSALGIGLDYDERFLTAVADGGRGEYAFLATGAQLEGFLARELDRASSTVAESVALELRLPEGVRIERAVGADVEQGSIVPLGPMAAGEQRRVTLALSMLAGAPGVMPPVGLSVRYRERGSEREQTSESVELGLNIVSTQAEVTTSRNGDVYARAEAVHLEDRQREAIELWQTGESAAASALAVGNAAALRELQAVAPSAALSNQLAEVEQDATRFERVSPMSRSGRTYRLQSNSRRRARQITGVWQ